MRYDFRNIYGFILALATAGMCGCAGDENLNPDINTGNDAEAGVFTLFTRAENESTTTYVLPDEFGNAQGIQDNEKIHKWSVFFINQETQEITEFYRDENSYGDDFQFSIDVEDGTYDIAAFANISYADARKLVEDGTLTYPIPNNGFTDSNNNLIPMSGYRKDVEIKSNLETTTYDYAEYHSHNKQNQNVIEVIRMAAKVEIKILNSTSNTLTLQSVDFGILQKGNIALFPDYSTLGVEFTEQSTTPSTESIKIDSNKTIAKNELEDIVFYVRESDARKTHTSERFMVTLTFKRDNGTTVETHYSATDALQWINRNDHIVIPIKVTDLTVDWEVLFYPPIGGYPAVVDSSDKFNYYCDFYSSGEFEILPVITDLNGDKITPNYTLSVGTTSGDTGIFNTQPRVSASGTEIVGILDNTEGLAIVPVTIKITSGESTGTERTRNIYIRRTSKTTTSDE